MSQTYEVGPWTYHAAPGGAEAADAIPDDRIGKWIVFCDDVAKAAELCDSVVDAGLVPVAKHPTDVDPDRDLVVVCLYLDGHDLEAHRTLLVHLVGDDWLPTDEDGLFAEVDFKFDWQTKKGLYGPLFVPRICFSDLMDRRTGEPLADPSFYPDTDRKDRP